MMECPTSEFRRIIAVLAAELAQSVQYKYLTGLEYDRSHTAALRIFTTSPAVFPLHEQKLFDDAPLMHAVSQGRPYIAQHGYQVKADYPDHGRIFKLGCGSLMNLPVTIAGKIVGQVNLMHESGFYCARKLDQALELTRSSLKPGSTESVQPMHLVGGDYHA